MVALRSSRLAHNQPPGWDSTNGGRLTLWTVALIDINASTTASGEYVLTGRAPGQRLQIDQDGKLLSDLKAEYWGDYSTWCYTRADALRLAQSSYRNHHSFPQIIRPKMYWLGFGITLTATELITLQYRQYVSTDFVMSAGGPISAMNFQEDISCSTVVQVDLIEHILQLGVGGANPQWPWETCIRVWQEIRHGSLTLRESDYCMHCGMLSSTWNMHCPNCWANRIIER